jgi:hypothetical protein
MPIQTITSADTSLKQVPAILRLVDMKVGGDLGFWAYTTQILDYGGGKYDLLTDELAKRGVVNLIYDPFNRSEDHNKLVRRILTTRHHGADHAFCSNVLNVIREREARREVLRDIKRMTSPLGTVFFTVYEGDRSSRGRRTVKGWQANRPTRNYEREIKREFNNVYTHGKLIVASSFK